MKSLQGWVTETAVGGQGERSLRHLLNGKVGFWMKEIKVLALGEVALLHVIRVRVMLRVGLKIESGLGFGLGFGLV